MPTWTLSCRASSVVAAVVAEGAREGRGGVREEASGVVEEVGGKDQVAERVVVAAVVVASRVVVAVAAVAFVGGGRE